MSIKIFPTRSFDSASAYSEAYFAELQLARRSIAPEAIDAAARLLLDVIKTDATILSCGNGGSAAISNHLLCDYLKGIRTGTNIRTRVKSLSSSPELITAIANDISFDDIFAYQVTSLGRPGDLLIATSSSGQSPNIVRAIEAAHQHGLKVVAMTGFAGGTASKMADVSLHVASGNYGIVEDIHQSLMHILAQYLRHAHLVNPQDLGVTRF
ncbi:phosphoheptose isomerase [Brevundimonas intermedia]|uniref:Phosphoheptose isomerase n=1 Tax=Brevundimonas intermedia TaxID=74315 RepID=A0ABQ5T964_9CAUL|nr:SIS domain-containing protein [Brevundimonas intermedia]GLK49327.1 phosphoheptose isomerase [Brevundimonas intermedia]